MHNLIQDKRSTNSYWCEDNFSFMNLMETQEVSVKRRWGTKNRHMWLAAM